MYSTGGASSLQLGAGFCILSGVDLPSTANSVCLDLNLKAPHFQLLEGVRISTLFVKYSFD